MASVGSSNGGNLSTSARSLPMSLETPVYMLYSERTCVKTHLIAASVSRKRPVDERTWWEKAPGTNGLYEEMESTLESSSSRMRRGRLAVADGVEDVVWLAMARAVEVVSVGHRTG